MNARKSLSFLAVLLVVATSGASAAVKNINSVGRFVPMGTQRVASHRMHYHRSYHSAMAAPMVAQSPAAIAAPAPALASAPPTTQAPSVASAPTDARRFSYAPEASTTTAPATTSATTSAPTTARTYARPSYSHRSTSNAVSPWQLQKTDPRRSTTN